MNNEKKFIKLTPFKMQVLQSFPFIDEDFDAITNYELLCKVVEYLTKTIDNVNLLESDFKILYNYVHDYFDNLDVQEEVNNKLDEMAESGQLADIISQYLELAGVLAYNTLNDLVNAENIVDGSIARTLGTLSYDDGKGHYYKIRTITSGDIIDGDNIVALNVSDTLIAEKISNFEINVLKEKTNYITPEMFGAKGDGETDDIQAFKDMIAYIDSIVPTKELPNEASIKDYSYITIKFSGIYAVKETINFTNTNGLILDNLKLIALPNFIGNDLILLDGGSRDTTFNNCILNGKLNVKNIITINDYSLVTRITNCWLTRFTEKGLYAGTGKGHELIVANTKINQVEWGERNDLATLVSHGIGIYLTNQRYDNHFTNVIINYCKEYSVENYSGANYFNQCHFYWTGVNNIGYHNYYEQCYFDGVPLKTKGFIFVRNCNFGSESDPFIHITDTYSNNWAYQNSHLIGNIFQNKGSIGAITNSIVFDDSSWIGHENDFSIEMLGNDFYDCPLMTYRTPFVYAPDPFKANIYTGNGDAGSVRIGDTLIQYGIVNEQQAGSDYVYFPQAYEGYTIDVILVPLDANSPTAFAGDINNQRFWANGVHGSVKWLAIGRMNR